MRQGRGDGRRGEYGRAVEVNGMTIVARSASIAPGRCT